MRRSFLPAKDASIYQEFSWKNTGHDEIIEVGKSSNGVDSIRSLLQFDITSLSSSISSGDIAPDSIFELSLFIARADDLQLDQSIQLYEVSSSWREGSGYFYQNTNVPYTSTRDPSGGYIETDGTTWKSRQSGSLWFVTGSDFYASLIASQSVADPVVDMKFDISTSVRRWISGTIANNGLTIKFPDSSESDSSNIGNIRFFSRQTHTIYSPTLTAKWNDQIYTTGSISASSATQVIVTPSTLSPKYRLGDIVRVDLSIRDKYPVKTFNTVFSAYAGNQRLPQTSYFSIVDAQSNTVIIPFDDYSRINCDGTVSYFKFSVEGMYPGRIYKVLVKVDDSGYINVFDLGHHFRIEQT